MTENARLPGAAAVVTAELAVTTAAATGIAPAVLGRLVVLSDNPEGSIGARTLRREKPMTG